MYLVNREQEKEKRVQENPHQTRDDKNFVPYLEYLGMGVQYSYL